MSTLKGTATPSPLGSAVSPHYLHSWIWHYLLFCSISLQLIGPSSSSPTLSEGFEVCFVCCLFICLLLCSSQSNKSREVLRGKYIISQKQLTITITKYEDVKEKRTERNCTEKGHTLGEWPNSLLKRLLLLFVFSYGSSLTGKWWRQQWKYNATFCSRENAKKKKSKGASFLPTLEAHFIPLLDFVLSLWLPWHQRGKCLASILKLNSLTNKIVSIWGYVQPPTPSEPFQKSTALKYGWNASLLRLGLGMGVRVWWHNFF